MESDERGEVFAGLSGAEPALSPEAAAAFAEPALIGGAKLRAGGFYVHVAKRDARLRERAGTPLVLVVEDDAETAALIAHVLDKHGFAARVAGNLQEIVRAVSLRPAPDVILLDVLLPDVNGFAVLERLRRHPELSLTPVVMLTSLAAPADVAKGLALGANGYLSKPAAPQALVAALREVLGIGGRTAESR
jgi:CheY-like chemotaxis protein